VPVRVACIRVPSFAVSVEQLAAPALATQLLAILDRKVVLEASPELALQPGLPARQAKALAPQATFIEAHHSLYREVFDVMLDGLELVTPLVERAEPGLAYADIGGLRGHYADEFALAGTLAEAVRGATGLLPAVGISNGMFVAWVAAWQASAGDAGIVPEGREREFLSDKDVSLLPFGPKLTQRLDLLALRTLGDIAALPQTAVEAQFRKIGRRLWELANGIDREPLRPRTQHEVLSKRLDFNAPVAENESLVAASRQLLSDLSRKLRGRTARRIQVQLLADEHTVWERTKTFREPTGDAGKMLLVTKTMLSLLDLPQAVDAVAITLSGIGREVARQAKLFADASHNLDRLAEDIRQLQARYGRPMVYHVVEVNPRSRHPEERTALVPFEP
jgi:nucleotidyltransferase/DNA polymerase involved in DNA repair